MDFAAILQQAPPAGARLPLQRQLLQRFKNAILDGRLAPGSRLPASRALAQQLGISRNTVLLAYEHLAAEGYVRADRQGTRVAGLARAGMPARASAASSAGPTARRLAALKASAPRTDTYLPLRPGTPALNHFPASAWRNALERALREAPAALLGYGEPAGEPRLRQAIAAYLAAARGVRCEARQIVITEGAQEGLALCVRLLGNAGDTAWVEDPGYRGAKTALRCGDMRVVPVRVDAAGLLAPPQAWRDAPPRLIYVTPSHQYPTGAVLPVTRRLALIEQARRAGAWIIEDDYDSEFRHQGEPIAAMQGLVPDAPVLYVGTYSKTMFPSLRLGFVVLPTGLADEAAEALAEMLRGGHRHEQWALASFIESGQFTRHLNRMRRLYRERQQALRAALARHLRVPHEVLGGHCGLHLTLRLPAALDDRAIAAQALSLGMAPQALSGFAIAPRPEDTGLVLGYGNTSAELFEPLIERLARLIQA